MLNIDYSNIDGPPLAVKCVRKVWSALGGEVCVCVCVCVCVYVHVRALTNFQNIFQPIFEFLLKMLKMFFLIALEHLNLDLLLRKRKLKKNLVPKEKKINHCQDLKYSIIFPNF